MTAAAVAVSAVGLMSQAERGGRWTTFTSKPLGVVFDGAQSQALPQAAVNHCVDGQEVSDGGGEQIPLWQKEKNRHTHRTPTHSQRKEQG